MKNSVLRPLQWVVFPFELNLLITSIVAQDLQVSVVFFILGSVVLMVYCAIAAYVYIHQNH